MAIEGAFAGWRVGGASVRGASHVRASLPNQDSFACWAEAGTSPAGAVVAVSDGHGSTRHFRSETGSKLAVEAALEIIREFASPGSLLHAERTSATALPQLGRSLPD